jgi:hypothetical protein
MSQSTPNRPVRYVAQITGAREVTLVGTADGDYWKARLEGTGLDPYRPNGPAELILSATALRWMGFRFNELVIALAVSGREDGSSRDGIYVSSAFNTSRVLAFCERALFRTPYQHGDVRVVCDPSFSFGLTGSGEVVLGAERVGSAGAGTTVEDAWEGPIYLPRRRGRAGGLFHARLAGLTEVHPWSASHDVLQLKPGGDDCPARALLDSGFVPAEWRVRRNATHARSRTYPIS